MASNKKIILKKLKELNTIWHPDSNLVFKSREDKVVIGMYTEGNFIQLDNEAISLCEQWGFKFDESLVSSEPEDESEPEPEPEEEHEEEPEPEEEHEEEPEEEHEEEPETEEEHETEDEPEEEPEPEPEEEPEEEPETEEDHAEEPVPVVEQSNDKPGIFDQLETMTNTLRSLLSDNTKTITRLTDEKELDEAKYDELMSKYEGTQIELDKLQKKFKALKGLFE